MIVFIFLLLFYVLQCLILPKMFLLPAHRLDLRWKRLDHCEIDIYQVKKKLRGLRSKHVTRKMVFLDPPSKYVTLFPFLFQSPSSVSFTKK